MVAAISYQPRGAFAKSPSSGRRNPMWLALLVTMLSVAEARADDPSAGEATLKKCEICHTVAAGGGSVPSYGLNTPGALAADVSGC